MKKRETRIPIEVKWFIGILILIIFVLIGQFIYTPYIEKKAYLRGYNDGTSDLIFNIQKSRNIPYFTNETGNISIKTIPITKLCENMK